jgi:hypothetical protein
MSLFLAKGEAALLLVWSAASLGQAYASIPGATSAAPNWTAKDPAQLAKKSKKAKKADLEAQNKSA